MNVAFQLSTQKLFFTINFLHVFVAVITSPCHFAHLWITLDKHLEELGR